MPITEFKPSSIDICLLPNYDTTIEPKWALKEGEFGFRGGKWLKKEEY